MKKEETISEYEMSGDCYAAFVMTRRWEDGLATIEAVFPELAAAIGEHGFGEGIDEHGLYDGAMYDSLPSGLQDKLREDKRFDSAHSAVTNLVNDYARFVRERYEA